MSVGISEEQKLTVALEAWKTTVEVQEHFNTIEMQIRNIAVAVLTAAIGAAALVHNAAQKTIAEAVKAGQPIPALDGVSFLWTRFSGAQVIVMGGLVAWTAFYFMDRWWYHKLLHAAVSKGTAIEDYVKKTWDLDVLGLSGTISAGSPIVVFGHRMHSNQKLDFFYAVVAVLLGLLIWLVF